MAEPGRAREGSFGFILGFVKTVRQVSNSFRKNLRRIRRERDLTQRQLAEMLGRSEQWYVRLEAGVEDRRGSSTGIASINLKTLVQLCYALEVNVQDLFEDFFPKDPLALLEDGLLRVQEGLDLVGREKKKRGDKA